jgi:hypothetical protein
VGALVDEPGRIKERLLVAYAGQLSRVHPQYDLPEAVADDYRALRYALSDEGMPYGYGEHAAKKLEAMSEAEASEVATKVFTIYTKLVASEVGAPAA